ncbi:hypothetical protein M422DRAFT_272230 [Sphaerobolus stellatus SS14]|uniref:Uncharacterized protein n=1 Tax=Sphaerobolus stellatus (strain SS14) TaxID=990650 RepID=A0A0C9TBW9_SPHS4|nr:hypothetical protein M422DRAFT_272230 [Sphaerobolus stellatus SS14]
MQYPVIQEYYSRLSKGSIEADVDSLWINILGLYFTVPKNYGLEQETRPLSSIKRHADISIRCVKNGKRKKVILIEDKRVEYESQSSKWAEAVEQLTEYLGLVRKEQTNDRTLYAIATVGHYSRFYQMTTTSNTLEDFPGTDGAYFEFKKDEAQIEYYLDRLVSLTS